MPYGMSAPAINPNTFPYLKKFTPEEREDLFERIDDIRFALRDLVGPSGVLVYIDDGTIANIAFHLAMAGGRVIDDEKAYIWPDEKPDPSQIFEGFIRWRLKKEHEPPPPKPADKEKAEALAEAARKQIERQLPPEVLKLLRTKLAEAFEEDTTDPEPEKDGAE